MNARILLAGLLLALPCAAEPAPPPPSSVAVGDIHPTCPPPIFSSSYAIFRSRTHSELIALRPVVEQYIKGVQVFAACLRGALKALQAQEDAVKQPPDPIVAAAVDNAINSWQRNALQLWSEFDNAATRDKNHHRDDPVARIELDEAEQMPPDIAPPPGTKLTLPSYSAGASHDCIRFYPEESVRENETGIVSFTYDVSEKGVVSNMRITRSSGVDRLDAAAVACVHQQWQNYPAILDGVPVGTTNHRASVSFDLS